ncbi:MAG: SGNH/GDSL hydrolase family protein [Planctomycetaceae bacterium]|nr:SGNH/GDSL hydrolase family protein [Planctomycetaceae bacterium]
MMLRLLLVLLMTMTLSPGLVSADDSLLRHVVIRSTLGNCRQQFTKEKQGHVAFLGGSITEMNGYRPMVAADLQKRFPETEFTFTNAGIASTCSSTGAFRVSEDVLVQGPVDLLFVEFAVNDDQDAHHSLEASRRGMEGIVRQTLQHNPRADIVMTYFVNPEMLEQTQQGKTPVPVQAHNQVAEHYGLNTIVLTEELANQIQEGTITWEKYGGTHPAPAGNAIPAAMINAMFDQIANDLDAAPSQRASKLPEPLDPLCYDRGRFLAKDAVSLSPGWSHEIPDWKSIPGSFRNRFGEQPLYVTTMPGAKLTVNFEGQAFGVYVLAGPDAGTLACQLDGGAAKTIDLYHHYSQGLHYPRTVMFFTDLPSGRHTATIWLAEPTTSTRPANAARILQFVAN